MLFAWVLFEFFFFLDFFGEVEKTGFKSVLLWNNIKNKVRSMGSAWRGPLAFKIKTLDRVRMSQGSRCKEPQFSPRSLCKTMISSTANYKEKENAIVISDQPLSLAERWGRWGGRGGGGATAHTNPGPQTQGSSSQNSRPERVDHSQGACGGGPWEWDAPLLHRRERQVSTQQPIAPHPSPTPNQNKGQDRPDAFGSHGEEAATAAHHQQGVGKATAASPLLF